MDLAAGFLAAAFAVSALAGALASRSRLVLLEAGGLMGYGSNLVEIFRRTAIYVDKILKGANPGNLPVEQPTRFELVINGRTAKTLGLKIPNSLLVTAEKVIE